jgi:polyphosphate kinase
MAGVTTRSTQTAPAVRPLRRYAAELAEELEDLQTEPPPVGGPVDRFLDREASWLDWNARVLELAERASVPLLERVRFAAIFATNLDEFFMVRVAGLQRRLATGIAVVAPSGLGPRDQLALISERAHALTERHAALVREEVLPALAAEGICLLHYADLDSSERRAADEFFSRRVYPVLTPLAVDPAHPFPYISGLSLNLAVLVRDKDGGREHFARVKVPPLLPRLLQLGEHRFVPLEEVIAARLPELFPGMDVVEEHNFRVTRNEDVEVEEEEVQNLLAALERELTRRRFGSPVRLEVESTMTDRVLDLLVRELGVSEAQVYRLPGPLDLTALERLVDLDRPDLKPETFVPVTHPRLRAAEPSAAGGTADVFGALRAGDVLVHHPYQSFATSVQALVEQAAADPAVLAIKQTLYRTSGDSPIVDALIDAADAGKQVLVVVEIKARFDEQANIRWARALEQAGCHVVYGLVGLKTHSKLCLVVRGEEDGSLRRYVHIGTGNYNPKTARGYEDLGLLTADEQVSGDVADLFNHLSGYTKPRDYRTLLVAPDTLREGVLGLIRREGAHARAGRGGRIVIKVNSLVDEQVVDALYAASAAGVEIDLVVRGMCVLRPGVPGLSDRIRVRSIVGRFLEHSRVLRFANAGEEQVWLGSADLMHRNLDRRVEALVQVRDPGIARELATILDLATSEAVAAWRLCPDGTWERQATGPAGPLQDFQAELMHRYKVLAEQRVAAERTAEAWR